MGKVWNLIVVQNCLLVGVDKVSQPPEASTTDNPNLGLYAYFGADELSDPLQVFISQLLTTGVRNEVSNTRASGQLGVQMKLSFTINPVSYLLDSIQHFRQGAFLVRLNLYS